MGVSSSLQNSLNINLIKAASDGNLVEVRQLLGMGATPRFVVITPNLGKVSALWAAVVANNISISWILWRRLRICSYKLW